MIHDPEKEAEQEEKYVRGMLTNVCLVLVHVADVYVILNVLVAAVLKSRKK